MNRPLRVDGEPNRVLLISAFGEASGGGLFAFDGDTIERVDFVASRGLAPDGERLVRILDSPVDSLGSAGEILTYDERGVRSYQRVDRLVDPHDVLWHGDSLVAVSSFYNAVLWISPSGDVVREWRAPGELDSWHVNGVYEWGERLIGCAFGRYERFRQWSEGPFEHRGTVFDVETGEDLFTGLSCPHQPRFLDGTWVVCNSGLRELLVVDPKTGRPSVRVQLEGWTRGLTWSDDFVFVGESVNRLDRNTSRSPRTAAVAILDRHTWKLIDRLPVPAQEIYDLVLVSPALAAGVRRGFRTNPIRVAALDQYAMFQSVGVVPSRLWASGEPLPPDACRVRIQAALPEEVPASALVQLEATFENTGTAIFVTAPPHPVHIGDRWFPQSGDQPSPVEGVRSRLPRALPPRDPVTCSFTLKTPADEGTYELRLTLVQENVAWFDDICTENASTKIVRVVRS